MGACCDHLFQKQQIHTNESRLRLLQHKVTPSYHTPNDEHFTYFLHFFQQHHYLQRILRDYKHPNEQSEDTSDLSIVNEKIAYEYKQIEDYMKDYGNQGSKLRARMAEDDRKIKEQVKLLKGAEVNEKEACMVKLEIQSIEVVKGISRIRVVQEFGTQTGCSPKEEYLIINRMRSQKVYRQFIFPSASGSRLRLSTDPVMSAMTIDVDDISKAEAHCDVFNFKAKNEDFGFIAIRLQFVSLSQTYRKEKHQRLVILQKELKLCQMGKDGLQKLSQYHSDTNSLRNTFLSEPVSEYPNQYEA